MIYTNKLKGETRFPNCEYIVFCLFPRLKCLFHLDSIDQRVYPLITITLLKRVVHRGAITSNSLVILENIPQDTPVESSLGSATHSSPTSSRYSHPFDNAIKFSVHFTVVRSPFYPEERSTISLSCDFLLQGAETEELLDLLIVDDDGGTIFHSSNDYKFFRYKDAFDV